MLRYDTSKRMWDVGWPNGPFEGRMYHTSTLVGRQIWVIGGSNAKGIFDDVYTFDLDLLTWHKVGVR
jgi:hypothetical protein